MDSRATADIQGWHSSGILKVDDRPPLRKKAAASEQEGVGRGGVAVSGLSDGMSRASETYS